MGRKVRAGLALLLLACTAGTGAAAGELLLAPGASVTILDAADPSSRIVMTASPDSALDLTPLLSLKPGESVHSIVTQVQANQATRMTIGADGSVLLSPPAAGPAREPTPGLAGGVLIREAGQWRLHPAVAARTTSAPSQPPAPAPAQKATIFKPGVTREQAERDIAQCRRYAEQAATPSLRPAEKVSTYNAAMYSCLRGFGYEIRS